MTWFGANVWNIRFAGAWNTLLDAFGGVQFV
jgi:hypothetical protein